jgi:hypothetical protein
VSRLVLIPSKEIDSRTTYDSNFYGIRDDFPKSCLLTRSEKSPTIYFLTPGVGEILDGQATNANLKVKRSCLPLYSFDPISNFFLQIVHAGVKLFQRREYEDVKCGFRICAEGLPYLLPYITKRRLTVSLEDFHQFFKHEVPLLTEFSSEFSQKLKDLGMA